MHIQFYKYQGTGNDFVMIDNRSGVYDSLSVAQISRLCDRKFGIGADGLIKINTSESNDFEMDYYNSDGSKSFCGNGARCSVAFAQFLGLISNQTQFVAIDGKHEASIQDGDISLAMLNVQSIKSIQSDFSLHTGSPHYIQFVDSIHQVEVVKEGKRIRYSEAFKMEGINVNFVEKISENSIWVRTYERGVENETLSCGTGVTAAALTFAFREKRSGNQLIYIETLGGKLAVSFEMTENNQFKNIRLIGPGTFVFQGEIYV
jgi:diaminopimelate epimerase